MARTPPRTIRSTSTTPRNPARRALVIGPAEAGSDVGVISAPATAERESPSGAPHAPSAVPDPGYAHINVWRLNELGAAREDQAARLIAAELERQPGFRFYALVQTGAREVVAVTVFDTQEQLRRAMDAVAPLVRQHVAPLAAAAPERRAGVVLHARAA